MNEQNIIVIYAILGLGKPRGLCVVLVCIDLALIQYVFDSSLDLLNLYTVYICSGSLGLYWGLVVINLFV